MCTVEIMTVEDKSFECFECHKRFSRSDTRNSHILRVHNTASVGDDMKMKDLTERRKSQEYQNQLIEDKNDNILQHFSNTF